MGDCVINIKNLIKNRFIKENIKLEKSKNLIKGPSYESPAKAVIGFAKSFNTEKNNLIVKNTDKGKYYFFKNTKKPNIKNLLASIIETELKRVTWKKSMKWGNNNLRWG